ncbi:MAG: hypothetical protein WC308_01300 [archaeon]|jgi:hypothetical protein
MKMKILGIILVLALMISGAYAYQGYSGYNTYYYTNNYKSNYYSTPAQAYVYNHYAYPYYGTYGYNYYYPAVPAYYGYYPVYGYYGGGSYNSLSIYGNGYALTYTRGYGCGYYGYYC